MRTLIVCRGYGRPGGVTVDVDQLVDGLEARGHRATVASELRSVARALRDPEPSVVHCVGCLPEATVFAAMAMARLRGKPLVWTPIFHPSRAGSWTGYRLGRAMELFDRVAPRAGRLASAVVAGTEAERSFFAALTPRVELIPSAVRPPGPPPSSELVREFRARHGVGRDPVVAVVARNNSRKALPFALRTFGALQELVPSARLLLVGSAPAEVGAQHERVHGTGWLGAGAMDLAYHAADLVFVPSLYERCSRTVLEAWRNARPVAVTDRVGFAPLVRAAGGTVVPYGRAAEAARLLARDLREPARAAAAACAGRDLVVDRFLLDDAVDAHVALYGELIGARA
jgi:glycosyltransferase involved in cell wall biosynthesis